MREEEKVTRELLHQNGVWPEGIDELLAKLPNLTVDIVSHVRRGIVEKRVDSVGAVLFTSLKKNGARLIEREAKLRRAGQERARSALVRDELLREAGNAYAADADGFEAEKERLWPSTRSQGADIRADAAAALIAAGVATPDEKLDWRSMARGPLLVLAVRHRKQHLQPSTKLDPLLAGMDSDGGDLLVSLSDSSVAPAVQEGA